MPRLPALTIALQIVLLGSGLGRDVTAGDRVRFSVVAEEQEIPGAEVCFFPAAGRSSPTDLFLGVGNTRCLPADRVIEWTPGVWHFYARVGSDLVSGHRGFVFDFDGAPGDAFQEVRIPVVPAATVIAGSQPTDGESLAVWIGDTEWSTSTIRPFGEGETELLVPATTPLVPLLIAGGRIIRVGEVLRLRPQEQRSFELSAPQHDLMDVVTWLEPDRGAILRAGPAEPPIIELTSRGGAGVSPLLQPGSPAAARFTLLFFKDVPRAEGEISLSGDDWAPASVTYTSPSAGSVLTTESGLPLTPAASLSVRFEGRAPARLECDQEDEPVAGIVYLERCTDGECRRVDQRSLETFEDVKFAPLTPGNYRVHYGGSGVSKLSEIVHVPSGTSSLVELEPLPFRLHGTVTRDGTLIGASLRFATGRARSDAQSGWYEAFLSADPGQNLIFVEICGESESVIHIPAGAIHPNGVLDIDLTVLTLDMLVEDAEGRPLPGADVKFVVQKSREGRSAFYGGDAYTTDEGGRVTLGGIPPDRYIRLCAGAANHEDLCSEPFLSNAESKGERVLRLRRRSTIPGRLEVVSGRAAGKIVFVSPAGDVISRIDVRDGRFSVPSEALEAAAYVVASTDVLFATQWVRDGDDVIVRQPTAGLFSSHVEFRGDLTVPRSLGLILDGFLVPSEIFFVHQSEAGEQIDTSSGRVRLSRVAPRGEVVLIVGPGSMPPGTRDIFPRPEYRALQRVVIRPGIDVVHIK